MDVRPRLLIPAWVMRQLQAYVTTCPVEINGFGIVERLNPQTFRLDYVYILDQDVSYVHAETDPDALARNDRDLEAEGLYEKRRFQWHSHVDFAAFFSAVDVRNIMRREESWLISMVLNKHGDFEARLDVNVAGIRRQRPISVIILLEEDSSALAKAAEDIDRHVRFVNTPHSIAAKVARGIMGGGTVHEG